MDAKEEKIQVRRLRQNMQLRGGCEIRAQVIWNDRSYNVHTLIYFEAPKYITLHIIREYKLLVLYRGDRDMDDVRYLNCNIC